MLLLVELSTDCACWPYGLKVGIEEVELEENYDAGAGDVAPIPGKLWVSGNAPVGGAEVPRWLLRCVPPRIPIP